MGAQLQQLAGSQAGLGENFNYVPTTQPYWGSYTEPMNINPVAQATNVKTDKRGKTVTQSSKKTSQSSFDNPSPLPNYSMYIPPEQMPDVNAYLVNPNSLLGAMQSAGVQSSGAGRFSNAGLLGNKA